MKRNGKTAIVFPGQGSQEPGMGKEFYQEWNVTRDLFDRMDKSLDIDLYSLCFSDEGSDKIVQTEYTQPCVLSVGASVAEGLIVNTDVEPDFVAGHSLGHYSSLCFADSLSPEKAVSVVRERGRSMKNDSPPKDSTMKAVLLADPDMVTQVCAEIDNVDVSGYNTPKQTVISGSVKAVEEAESRIKEKATVVRFAELSVSEAFHSPLMQPVQDEFSKVLNETEFDNPIYPVVSDTNGEVYNTGQRGAEILNTQLVKAVDWVSVVETMKQNGVERYIEVPPSGTLSGFIPKIHDGAEVISLETPRDIEEL